jgi:hypothetical protein
MKKIVAILVFAGIMLQSLSKAVIIMQYYANKDYIAKNLCENRDKPQMHCEGKCCLKKRLEKDQNAPTSSQKDKQDVVLYCFTAGIHIAYSFFPEEKVKYFSHNDLATYTYSSAVFHPPTAA